MLRILKEGAQNPSMSQKKTVHHKNLGKTISDFQNIYLSAGLMEMISQGENVTTHFFQLTYNWQRGEIKVIVEIYR